jgi:phosphohistidine phosphatase SixA
MIRWRGAKNRRETFMTASQRILTLLASAAVLLSTVVASGQSASAQQLLGPLRAGGLVIVMRHASSPRETPTKDTAAPGNAKLERQLDDAGRNSATATGMALRQLGIPIASVVSSGTFRALQTVRFAGLGEPTVAAELGDGGESMQAATDAQSAWLRSRVTQVPPRGNVLLVTHMPNISRAFPDWGALADGECVVLRPDGKAFTVLGRIKIEEWPTLAASASSPRSGK